MKWPDVIQTIAKQYGVIISDSEVLEMPFEEKKVHGLDVILSQQLGTFNIG